MVAAAKTVVHTSHTLLLTKSNEVLSWGYNAQGQLGHGSAFTGVFAATPRVLNFVSKECAHVRHIAPAPVRMPLP
jgi:alpha-tubulin suppressor-like RCC1 family protein